MFEDVRTCELTFVDEPASGSTGDAEKQAGSAPIGSIAPVAVDSALTSKAPPTVLSDDPSPHLPGLASRVRTTLGEPLALRILAMALLASVFAFGLGVTLGRAPGRPAAVAASGASAVPRAPRAAVVVGAREQLTLQAPSALNKDPQVDVELDGVPPPRPTARSGASRRHAAARPRGFGHLGASR